MTLMAGTVRITCELCNGLLDTIHPVKHQSARYWRMFQNKKVVACSHADALYKSTCLLMDTKPTAAGSHH